MWVVSPPKWNKIESSSAYGLHLSFGEMAVNEGIVKAPDKWLVIDNDPVNINTVSFDLLKDDWEWDCVSVIHCVCMLYQWDYVDVDKILRKCCSVLADDGVLWLAESNRDVNVMKGHFSSYTINSLRRMAMITGFNNILEADPVVVCGRPADRTFALECRK